MENNIKTENFEKTKEKKIKESKLLEINVRKSEFVSSRGKYPQIVRCNKCFMSHFPIKKICRKLTLRKESRASKTETRKKSDLFDANIVNLILGAIHKIEASCNKKNPENVCKGFTHLRGGALEDDAQSILNLQESLKSMIAIGIANARSHGINLKPGIPNLATGDCA